MMESRGRRAPRGAAPIAASEPAVPIEVPLAAPEPAEPAALLAGAAEPAETALKLVTTAGPALQPIITMPTSGAKSTTPNDVSHFGGDAVATLAQSQAALARGLESLTAEMAGLALSGFDTAARTATKMLSVKTLSDAIALNAGFTCSNLDILVDSSAKLSQLGVKLAAETCQPILSHLGKGWITASRSAS